VLSTSSDALLGIKSALEFSQFGVRIGRAEENGFELREEIIGRLSLT
jgi:hypothetical protein